MFFFFLTLFTTHVLTTHTHTGTDEALQSFTLATGIKTRDDEFDTVSLVASDIAVGGATGQQLSLDIAVGVRVGSIPTVSVVTPNTIPSRSDVATELRVIGERFVSSDFQCVFISEEEEEFVSTATTISSTELVCPCSVAASKLLIREVTSGYQSSPIVLTTYEPASLIEAIPTFGPSVGSTLLRLRFESFDLINNNEFKCRFISFVTDATLVSESTVECRTPPGALNTEVEVEFSQNGGHSWFSTNFSFRYEKREEIYFISPSFGAMSGGTTVEIQGRYFREDVENLCVFGTHAVSAQYISSSKLVCETPSSHNVDDDTEVNVYVTSNSVDMSDGDVKFDYVLPPSLTSIFPTQGVVTGGTKITIRGEHFTDPILVTFGNTNIIIESEYISSQEVRCESPFSSDIGAVSVSVSSNGVDFIDDTLSFTYV